MQRKKCALCGKWEITDKIVMSCHGKTYCSICYHDYKSIMEYPEQGGIRVNGGNCFEDSDAECWGCKKIDECIKEQVGLK